MIKNIALGLGGVLVIIQFFQIDKIQPEVNPSLDFISLEQPPQEVENLLRSACYDCHSYESEYPWYTNIQPVAWLFDHHIDHSQEYLNFSEWGNYSLSRADHKAAQQPHQPIVLHYFDVSNLAAIVPAALSVHW